jgi:Flp pilus assembly protein TadD
MAVCLSSCSRGGGTEEERTQARRRAAAPKEAHGETASSAVTADRERVRRRVLAFTGVWFLVAGLLTALSLVVVVLIASALMLLVSGLAVGLSVLRRHPISPPLRASVASIERARRRLARRRHELGFGRHLRRLGARARNVGIAAPGRTRVLLIRGGQVYAVAVYRLLAATATALRAGGRLVPSLSGLTERPVGRERQALRLNERGAQLRRRGNPEQAVEQHRVALAIVRDLGDQHAEALTLNNLGLALAQEGADASAVRHLEQAVTVLRELGDQEHEGQVIANLGFVHGRQGRSEEALTLLHEALDKLPPESSAYRQVEEELRRAS